MTLRIETAATADIPALLPDLARLRIRVFGDFPYLYKGDLAYEERYLAAYSSSPGAMIVTVRDGPDLVGAATGAPLGGHDRAFAEPLARAGHDPDAVFYCAESVLLPAYRGRGVGHAFFDHREAMARSLGLAASCFCAVIRPDDHPARPRDYTPLDGFWRKRGYAPLPGVIARYSWRDTGDAHETEKPMQVWLRELD